jgi:hypothetical protein
MDIFFKMTGHVFHMDIITAQLIVTEFCIIIEAGLLSLVSSK